MKLDLHIHSSYSRDASGSPEEIVARCRTLGLDGCAITDHNALRGSLKAFDELQRDGFVVVRGIEVSSIQGHVLGYGVQEPVPKGLPLGETVERIRDLGGVPVAAHPVRFPSGIGLDAVRATKFGAIEVLNGGNSKRANYKAKRLSEELALPGTGGSDAHKLDQIGKAWTFLEGAAGEDDVLQRLGSGDVRAEGRSRTSAEGFIYSGETLVEWLRRGFRRL